MNHMNGVAAVNTHDPSGSLGPLCSQDFTDYANRFMKIPATVMCAISG